jgi:hypothetical protein
MLKILVTVALTLLLCGLTAFRVGLKHGRGTLRVTRSAILFNDVGVDGDVWSLGDNRLVGNVTANEFPPRPSDNRLQ